MKIKMQTIMCGPFGNFAIGEVADLDEAEARALIDGGYAHELDLARETAAVAAPEAAIGPGAGLVKAVGRHYAKRGRNVA